MSSPFPEPKIEILTQRDREMLRSSPCPSATPNLSQPLEPLDSPQQSQNSVHDNNAAPSSPLDEPDASHWPTSNLSQTANESRDNSRDHQTGEKAGSTVTQGCSMKDSSLLLETPIGKFDHVGLLTEFEGHEADAVDLEKYVTQGMLGLMLDMRVWAECRLKHENDLHGNKLLSDLDGIEAREVEQEKNRLSVVNFFSSLRLALSALTHT